jgi:hypothetical protein
MNRLAVVLAADSATTVTHWSDKGKEERYFKGANKIFQLSNFHPVGMMIFDSADLLKVPWEVVAKEFRSTLGKKAFDSLDGYASEFFSFLNSNTRLFPAGVQKEVFLSAARTAALRTLFRIGKIGEDDNANRAAAEAGIAARRAEVDAMPLAPGIEEGPPRIVASWGDDLVKMLENWRGAFDKIVYPTDIRGLAELGILEIFKSPQEFMGTTGLVFAGFGDHDVFPAMIAYTSYGMIAGKHVAHETVRMALDHETPAWLSAFAQTSMSDTFSLGLSQDVYTSVMESLSEGLHPFAEAICDAVGGDIAKVPDLAALIAKTTKGISDAVLDKARNEHAFPLRRVLGALPVDEMAELAETLINLQSLKEKVTKPSETVGGPIDVAVITKSEGLVWIKRKHFFDPSLNSRYMQRLAAIHD